MNSSSHPTMFTLEHKLGDIVASLPQASYIFTRHRIDFCCKGNKSLKQLCESEKPFDTTQLLKELNQASEEFEREKRTHKLDFLELSVPQLIQYIIEKHHNFLRSELPEIASELLIILNAHYTCEKRDLLLEIYHVFHTLKMELDVHMIEEEQIVFPNLIKYSRARDDWVLEHLQQLEEEHDLAIELLKKLRNLTCDFSTPKLCEKTENLLKKLNALVTDCEKHIQLENALLFKRFE